MTSESGYQGWKNRETWCAALWIGNEQGLYEEACEMANAAADVYHLSKDLEAWWESIFEEQIEELNNNSPILADFLNHGIDMVDWYEIAEHYYADADHEADDDESDE